MGTELNDLEMGISFDRDRCWIDSRSYEILAEKKPYLKNIYLLLAAHASASALGYQFRLDEIAYKRKENSSRRHRRQPI